MNMLKRRFPRTLFGRTALTLAIVLVVFQPFYRIEKSRNMTTGGSGLGLAGAKQLTDSNDWVFSLHPHADEGAEDTRRQPFPM